MFVQVTNPGLPALPQEYLDLPLLPNQGLGQGRKLPVASDQIPAPIPGLWLTLLCHHPTADNNNLEKFWLDLTLSSQQSGKIGSLEPGNLPLSNLALCNLIT